MTIEGPATASDGQPVDLTVRIANGGSTRSTPFDLVITATQTEVLCSPDPSGTSAFQPIWPKAFVETDLSIAQGCLIQSTGDPNLVLDGGPGDG